MSSTPLVSVTIPCYNAANTLPMALSSLIAQTYDHWECIVVDDGSNDAPESVVAQINDDRIRTIHLPVNRGRAVARQVALDSARGQYLCKLDADDWVYPTKIALQVASTRLVPEAGLISTGIAIVNANNDLVGVRARGIQQDGGEVLGPMPHLGPPPVAHAPSMVRMDLAKRIRYDNALRRGEDADYLLQLLMSERYHVLHDVTYAYSEYRSATMYKTLDAYQRRMQMYWKYRHHYPARSLYYVGESALKWMLYGIMFAVQKEDVLLRRRSVAPSVDDAVAFRAARRTVMDVYGRVFEQPPLAVAKVA